jgi:hypothetical protein
MALEKQASAPTATGLGSGTCGLSCSFTREARVLCCLLELLHLLMELHGLLLPSFFLHYPWRPLLEQHRTVGIHSHHGLSLRTLSCSSNKSLYIYRQFGGIQRHRPFRLSIMTVMLI